jgi:hypothetical protein
MGHNAADFRGKTKKSGRLPAISQNFRNYRPVERDYRNFQERSLTNWSTPASEANQSAESVGSREAGDVVSIRDQF